MHFVLQVSKHGNLMSLVEELCKKGIATKDFMDRLVYNTDVEPEDVKKLAKLVFIAGDQFNKQFSIKIVDQDRNMTYTPKYESYNNVKQLILAKQLHDERPISTVDSMRKAMKDVDAEEKNAQLPFWQWREKEIQAFINQLAHKSQTPHTIATKVSLLGNAEEQLRELTAHLRLSKAYAKPYRGANAWRDAGKTSREDNNNSYRQRLNKRVFFNYDNLRTDVLNKTTERAAAAVLLVFKGVKFSVNVAGEEKHNEIGEIKLSDFKDNILKIQGACARQIDFTESEMKYIRPLMVGAHPDDYLFRRQRKGVDKPVTRWSFTQLLAQASKESGIKLTYHAIRSNGEMYFIDRIIDKNYTDPNLTYDEFINVFIECMERFGAARKGTLGPDDFSSQTNPVNYGRLYKIKELRQQYINSMMR